MRRSAMASCLLFALAACGGSAPIPSSDIAAGPVLARATKVAPSVATRSAARLWTLADVEISFEDRARLFWFEATYTSDQEVERRAATVMRIALTQAATEIMNGGKHVTLEARIREFRGLSSGQVYSVGGKVTVDFDLIARDSVSGETLATWNNKRLVKHIPGGMMLLVQPGSQRSLITEMIRGQAGIWLSSCCTG